MTRAPAPGPPVLSTGDSSLLSEISALTVQLASVDGGGFLDTSALLTGIGGDDVAVMVASSDAPALTKAIATSTGGYVCDGTNDQAEINSALIDAAPLSSRNSEMSASSKQLGKVLLSGGRFNIAGSIQMPTATWLDGSGWGTELRAVSGLGANHMITLAAIDSHLVHLSNFYAYGNGTTGGTGDIIHFDMTGSTSTGSYPDTNPDSYFLIHDLFLDQANNGTRNGIWLGASSTANNRGNIIDRCQIRDMGANCIWMSTASDSYISNTHIGDCNDSGIRVEAGNTKIANCKAVYCETAGFTINSGRHYLTGIEAQDNVVGFAFNGGNTKASSVTCDTSSTAGIVVGAAGLQLGQFDIYVRAGGRYSTQSQGLVFNSAYADCSIIGRVDPSNITTPITGTVGARSFMRVSNGSSLVSVG